MISNFNYFNNFDYYKYHSMFPKEKYSPFENTNPTKYNTINDIILHRKHDIVTDKEPTKSFSKTKEIESIKNEKQSIDSNKIKTMLTKSQFHLPLASFWGIED